MADLATCALCPRLCRPACPVASGTGREAAVPTLIATVLFDARRGFWSPARAAEAATLCVRCGACEAHCHIKQPLPALLAEARATYVPEPAVEALRPIVGEGDEIALECDSRRWAEALSTALGRPIRRWGTADSLGVEAIEHRIWEDHARAIRERVGELTVVVADGGSAEALESAGARFRWLHEVLPELASGLSSCRTAGAASPLACCGGAPPLSVHHPVEARRVAETWSERASSTELLDARCKNHMARARLEARDSVDRLLAKVGP